MVEEGYAGDGPGRECWNCGYVSYGDEIDDDTKPGHCPQCGRPFAEREEP